MIQFHNTQLIAEYITATNNFSPAELTFNGQGAKPSAINFEIGQSFILADKPATFGIAYQVSEQALGLDFAKSSLSTAVNIHIMDKTLLSFEVANKNDYSINMGGTGETSKSFTAKLTVEL